MKYLFLLTSSFLAAVPAVAEEGTDAASSILVTGSSIPVEQAGQSVSVIDAGELDRVQGPDIARALERIPGVVFARSGPLGGQTSLFVRGAGSEQVLVLIDGVRVNDVASPGGAYDFANLMTGGIGRIELLRGSNSVVWGSQAIGGVLAVTTREVNGVEAAAEYGSHDSFDGQVNAGIAGERYSLGVTGGYTRTDGVSSAAAGAEPDGFRQWRIGGRGRAELVPGLSAVATARHADSRLDMDGYPAPAYVFADTPEYQKTRETSGRAGLEYTGGALLLNGGFGLSNIRRAYYDPTYGDAPNYVTRGRSERADLSGRYDFTPSLRLDFGTDSEWSRFSVSGGDRHRARLASGHALLGWQGERLSLAAGVRYDDHSRFGHEWTFGANGNFLIADGWRVRASYGEGFKAPTLYQLFSDYGNTALRPERSRSYEAGIAKGDRNAGLHFAVTAFRRTSRNLIDYVSCFSSSDPLCSDGRFGFYDNVGRARAQGVEVELGARLGETLHAQAAYTWLDAENRTRGGAQFGNALARRPRHTVTVSADWTSPLHGLTLCGDLRMVSDSYDDAGNFTRNEGHATATVRVSLPLGNVLELFGRVENVTDARHTAVAGYGVPGRTVTAGARARF